MLRPTRFEFQRVYAISKCFEPLIIAVIRHKSFRLINDIIMTKTVYGIYAPHFYMHGRSEKFKYCQKYRQEARADLSL